MLMCLSNLGRVLAESVRQTYARLCIRQSDHYKCTTDDGSGIGGTASGNGAINSHRNTYHSAEEKNEVTRNYGYPYQTLCNHSTINDYYQFRCGSMDLSV